MSRDSRTRRLSRPASGGVQASASGDAGIVAAPLVTLLARTSRLIDLLPQLHQHALDATGGDCSLLFEFNPGNGAMQATSGFGLDELRTEPWVPVEEEGALVADAFARHAATLVLDARRQMPDLTARLAARAVLLLPVAREAQRLGLFVVGFQTPPSAAAMSVDTSEIADALLVALELSKLRQKEDLQRDLREVLDEFSSTLATTLNLGAGLDVFCHAANRLFGADRTSVWIHDRRARHLVLRASSDPEHMSRGVRVSGDDSLAPAAAAMRRSRAEILAAPVDEP